jgi:gamma-glutamylcyclotransferase (GGCT)/AIG2-like uncharacterized protein YtfP
MKTIFVYGTLQVGFGNCEAFQLAGNFIAKASLYGWTRKSLTWINKVKNDESYVVGEIFKVTDAVEQDIFNFEHAFGYHREIVTPQRIDNGEKVEAIAYIL